MSDLGYAYQQKTKDEKVARIQGVDLRISPKESYEVANTLRGMNLAKAKKLLEQVVELKTPIRYGRYNHGGTGHRKGHFGQGRFPVNTSKQFLKLLNSLEANAGFKGMNASQLVLFHIAAHKAAPVRHSFKGSPHMTQTTHVEIVAKEDAGQAAAKKKVEKAEGKK